MKILGIYEHKIFSIQDDPFFKVHAYKNLNRQVLTCLNFYIIYLIIPRPQAF